MWSPLFRCVVRAGGDRSWRVGHDLVDEFLEFAPGRARPATVRAYAHGLTVFFSIVEKDPVEVRSRDVLAFVSAQQRPRPGAENIVRISDGGAGLSASTIKRRLAAVSSFYGYLVARGEVAANPVPRGLPTRKSRHRDRGTVPSRLSRSTSIPGNTSVTASRVDAPRREGSQVDRSVRRGAETRLVPSERRYSGYLLPRHRAAKRGSISPVCVRSSMLVLAKRVRQSP